MKPNFCPNYSAPLSSLDADKDTPATVYRARCKQWDCPYCAEINRRVWRARIMLEVAKTPESLWYFWTLTLDGVDHRGDVGHSLQIWRNVWDRLMKQIRRDLGKLRYVRNFETHADGTLHVHMLVDATYPDATCHKEADGRENWRSIALCAVLRRFGLGWRHDLKPIVTERPEDDGVARNVSAYFAKYLTKEIQSGVRADLRRAGLGRVRMIQASRGWAQTPLNSMIREWRSGGISRGEFERLRVRGVNVYDIDNGRFICTADFYGGDHYPNKYSDLADIIDSRSEVDSYKEMR